eukprot:4370513-Amphidinium_carterae.1
MMMMMYVFGIGRSFGVSMKKEQRLLRVAGMTEVVGTANGPTKCCIMETDVLKCHFSPLTS